ncbi:ATPase component of general energizing module of ECF transporters [Halalkalibacter wakoensis JCM 9140]|uniref:Energy-coupling factor transporter ATP-binding protein EcfA2 n=1 Tax=Halalkalibacter wakoensis JCM 9140 TaxID=1236970 RepID=W4Q257_9BACI|nr:energy-coupling factor ABC transporter ATP-binding protein [Halalkalibacter wakoensis]GAE26067.1 ATPase component of general energizing module of ECF transporters [Halalkalibacter wakoensis JCM 9140]
MDIVFSEVEYRYMQGTPFEKVALKDLSITIPSGSFTAVIGHTGSGKSTFIQHINGLLRPSAGSVKVGSFEMKAGKKKQDVRELRKEVGLVFQYPEHQLFEETVEKDICFGPINFGLPKEKASRRAKELLPLVGLEEEVLASSPFQLSGGQMRRVAIAGVLAIEPSVLVLDEPAASLDPEGRQQMMSLFYEYHQRNKTTTVLVTHHMEDAAKYADQIIVFHEGRVEMVGGRELIFEHAQRLNEIGLDVPKSVRFLHNFQERFHLHEVPMSFEMKETAHFLGNVLKGE